MNSPHKKNDFDKNKERPYLQYSAIELSVLVDNNKENTQVLHAVLIELLHRKTRLAKKLRTRIIFLLFEFHESQFRRPSSEVTSSKFNLEFIDVIEIGLLSIVGYHAGNNGLPKDERQKILDLVYLIQLPIKKQNDYIKSWGKERSATRLKKMANSLAAFARNAKRNKSGDYSNAINDWESDLMYLKKNYYEKKYDFEWPKSYSIIL